MSNSLRIYCSYHHKDAEVVAALRGHLNLLLPEATVQYEDFNTVPEKVDTAEFIRKMVDAADVVLIFCSTDYFNLQETLLERDYAKRSPRKPLLLPLRCRAVPQTPGLEEYALVPLDGLPLSNEGRINDLQCALAARLIAQRMYAFEETHRPVPVWQPEPLSWSAALTRLQSWLLRNDLRISLRLLHHLVKDPGFDKIIFEAREQYERLHRRTQREQQSVPDFLEAIDAIRFDLSQLLLRLEPTHLRENWQEVLQNSYFGFAAIEKPETVQPGLAGLVDEILLPDTHNKTEDPDGDPVLSPAKQQEFKRLFILAQDAQAIGQYSKAHDLADQIRTNIDPESAQLYELLLVTLIQLETPDRIIQEALQGNNRLIDKVLRYAGRTREFQALGKCPSATGFYNLSAMAGTLNNALRRAYSALPNDYIIDTGLNAAKHPDSRNAVLRSLRVALDVYSFLHPTDGFLELAFNEYTGGGKYLWVDKILVQDDVFRVINRNEFDVLSEISNLENFLIDPELRNPDNTIEIRQRNQTRPFDSRILLRNNLLYCLRRKRNGLIAAIREEQRFFREFIDERSSLARFVYACILGYLVFDQRDRSQKSDFLQLALDELLRKPEVPWFTLDGHGQLAVHPDCKRLDFDPMALTATIIRHHVGPKTQAEIEELIRQTVYDQFAQETNALYKKLELGLSWTDIRRMRDEEARQGLVECIRRWWALYLAYPEKGELLLKNIVSEMTGDGYYLWMHFNPERLVTHPDSIALGFPAVEFFQKLEQYPLPWSKTHLEQRIVEKLYSRHILPTYEAIAPRDQERRTALIQLFRQSLRGYKTDPQLVYLDWIYQELTQEFKFRWVDIDDNGHWMRGPRVPSHFDPIQLLQELSAIDPMRFNSLETRRRIAERRYLEQEGIYFREISEYRHENRLPERQIAVGVFNKIKGIFKFYPERRYLEIPLHELSGQGRIRWQARLLGVFLVPENHHENALLNFDYKYARSEFMMLRDTTQQWMEQMLRDTGNLA
ncbi:MAG: toll/interleukin-1 receptor domain-containing protein [Lewinellaceae bacterium]|nr:toll/interleukin-1 receptor domain-containing protein [Lewinellaceae bacterium]